MKRLVTVIAALAAFAGPVSLTATEAQAKPGHGKGHAKHGEHGYGGDYRGGDRYDRYDRDDRDDRYDRRGRWDRGRHNGYYYNDRWFYGPPPSRYYGHPGYRPGHVAWRRGAYLPPYYRSNTYVVHNYGYYDLRPPPRGYYWYNDNGNYLLAAVATGLILDVIINH